MLSLFTFCVDIGINKKYELMNILKILISSLKRTKNEYELHIFTNFDININNSNIIFHKYFNNSSEFDCKWRNLNFNRLNIFKYLYEKYNKNFIWIDLDTIIVQNLEYLNKLDTFFIENGGNEIKEHEIFINNKNYTVKINEHIQGNFWKLNINLYNELIKCYDKLKQKNLKLNYDCQGLFNYYIHYKIKDNWKENNINILGKTIYPNIMYGEAIWNKRGWTHATYVGMKRLHWENYKLKSLFYPNKEIHLVSFTFRTILELYKDKKFKLLFKRLLPYNF